VTAKRVEGQVGFYEFDVREVFEGDVGVKTVVSTYTLSASCGRSFEIGTEYLVFTCGREVNAKHHLLTLRRPLFLRHCC
jgi:hypothetical protein